MRFFEENWLPTIDVPETFAAPQDIPEQDCRRVQGERWSSLFA